MNNVSNTLEPILIILSIFLVTILGFLLVIIRYNKNRILHIKDKQTFQQNLLNAQIETQEQTFENISQDLHDNIGQQMTALNFQIENQKLKQPENKESLDKISASVTLIANQLQTLSRSLNTNWLKQQGLITGIEKEIERLQNISTISFRFKTNKYQTNDLSGEQQIIIFRIFQEIINNALKHARAKTILVEITSSKPFQLSVTDDGIGFNKDEMFKASPGLGLQSIENRAHIIGFSCTIDSQPGIGTSFYLKEILLS